MFLYICHNRGYAKDEGAGMWRRGSGRELSWEGRRMGVEVREDAKCCCNHQSFSRSAVASVVFIAVQGLDELLG